MSTPAPIRTRVPIRIVPAALTVALVIPVSSPTRMRDSGRTVRSITGPRASRVFAEGREFSTTRSPSRMLPRSDKWRNGRPMTRTSRPRSTPRRRNGVRQTSSSPARIRRFTALSAASRRTADRPCFTGSLYLLSAATDPRAIPVPGGIWAFFCRLPERKRVT